MACYEYIAHSSMLSAALVHTKGLQVSKVECSLSAIMCFLMDEVIGPPVEQPREWHYGNVWGHEEAGELEESQI